MSVWNPENIKDIAESVGIASLNEDLVQTLARDVEYRLSQILEEAMKFMRHSKRTTLSTQDISQALRVLDVEPLYGYESTRPLRFGEASIGPGQPLFYVEDEEMDFEKLINAPLPKVPREMSFTGMEGLCDAPTVSVLRFCNSALACRRRRAAVDSSESDFGRVTESRTLTQGHGSECRFRRLDRRGQRERQTVGQAHLVQGTTIVL